MRGYLNQGFSDVKMKVGGVPLDQDFERVKAVREAIGPSARLMVDANYTLNVPRSLKMASAFEPYDVYWFEARVIPMTSWDKPKSMPSAPFQSVEMKRKQGLIVFGNWSP